MFIIKKLTKTVRINRGENASVDVPINGITGYYPICEKLKDAIEISEDGKYRIENISADFHRDTPYLDSEEGSE